jgi:Tol biopolymer transport system component
MIRRSAGVLGVLLVSLIGAGVSDAVETQVGPRLALTRVNESRPELATVDPSGSNQQVLVDSHGPIQPFPISPSGWSADGEKLAFVGASGDNDTHLDIYVQAVKDGGIFQVPGTRNGTHPLLSPDGHTVAFTRFKPGKADKKQTRGTEFAVWLADLQGGVVRRITPYRRHVSDVASSFSPDGSTLLLTRTVEVGAPAAVSIDLSRGRAAVIARRASDPVYSPDGTQIAFERVPRQTLRKGGSNRHLFTDLYTMRADGSGIRRLTKTGKTAEVRPSWDPSGQRLAYLEVAKSVGEGDFPFPEGSLGEINADGTCRTAIPTTPDPRIVGAVWQPGSGREAGLISC